MNITIEFNDDDEAVDAIKAQSAWAALVEIQQDIRAHVKHGAHTPNQLIEMLSLTVDSALAARGRE